MKTAPEVGGTTAGALTRPTEAEQTSTLTMASGWASRKEPVHGLRCLPDHRQEIWEGPEWKPALPVPHLPENVLGAARPSPRGHASSRRPCAPVPAPALRG